MRLCVSYPIWNAPCRSCSLLRLYLITCCPFVARSERHISHLPLFFSSLYSFFLCWKQVQSSLFFSYTHICIYQFSYFLVIHSIFVSLSFPFLRFIFKYTSTNCCVVRAYSLYLFRCCSFVTCCIMFFLFCTVQSHPNCNERPWSV